MLTRFSDLSEEQLNLQNTNTPPTSVPSVEQMDEQVLDATCLTAQVSLC